LGSAGSVVWAPVSGGVVQLILDSMAVLGLNVNRYYGTYLCF